MNNERQLMRIRIALGIVIVGLVVSGLTCFPIETESLLLEKYFGRGQSDFHEFIRHSYEGIAYTKQHYPFLFYGIDWLGFAHFAIALAFLAPFKAPSKHIWTLQWGVLICVLCIPAIFCFGWLRNLPLMWSFIDCLFPLLAIIPLLLSLYWANGLRDYTYEN